MSQTFRVKLTAYLVVATYSIAFLIYGITLPSTLSRVLSLIPVLVVLLFSLFDNVIWRVGPMPNLIRQPLLRGTWHGTLTSYRRDSSDQRVSSKHEVVVVIRQSLTTISVTMLSEQSKSRSTVAQLLRLQAEDYSLQYQYQNDPRLEFRQNGSVIHTGGAVIGIGGNHPTSLSGEYWTGRETYGSFELARVSDRCVTTFHEGQQTAATEER